MIPAAQIGGSGPSKITAAVRYIAEALNNLTQALNQFQRHTKILTISPYTVTPEDTTLLFDGAGAFTVTLPSPGEVPGKILYLVNYVAFTVDSASANVVGLPPGAPGTAILPATAGKWAILQSNGNFWLIIAAN